jgi:NAD(P)-dependent dehydrogenase (short-subunit alcohol dehydrogenase family)
LVDPSNTVFAIVCSPSTATKLANLVSIRPNLHVLEGDLTNVPQLEEAALTIGKHTDGTLDALINNGADMTHSTAIYTPTTWPDTEEANKAFHQAVETNVLGTINVTNAFLKLIENGNGMKIIHLSTSLVLQKVIHEGGLTYRIPYTISKAGVNILVAKYAVELKEKGIVVGV